MEFNNNLIHKYKYSNKNDISNIKNIPFNLQSSTLGQTFKVEKQQTFQEINNINHESNFNKTDQFNNTSYINNTQHAYKLHNDLKKVNLNEEIIETNEVVPSVQIILR